MTAPLAAAAVNATANDASPGFVAVMLGAEGTPLGATGEAAAVPLPHPATFNARTTTRYDTPGVNPDTTHDVASCPTARHCPTTVEPDTANAAYCDTTAPLSLGSPLGASTNAGHDTDNCPTPGPATAVTPATACGLPNGTTPTDTALAAPAPAAFTARTATPYDTPLVTPVIVIGDDVDPTAVHTGSTANASSEYS